MLECDAAAPLTLSPHQIYCVPFLCPFLLLLVSLWVALSIHPQTMVTFALLFVTFFPVILSSKTSFIVISDIALSYLIVLSSCSVVLYCLGKGYRGTSETLGIL